MTSTLFSNLFILILIILQLVVPIVFDILNIPNLTVLILAEYLILFIPSIIYIIVTKQNLSTALHLKPINLKSLLLLLLFSIIIQPSMSLLAAISSLVFPNNVSEFIMSLNELPLLLALFILAITPAICEEIAFRGAFASGYKNINIKKAALMNGLMFGFLHLNGQQFLYAFVMGILFTYIVYITGSIFSSMLVHFIFNGGQLLIARIATTYLPDNQAQEILSNPDINAMFISIAFYAFLTIVTIPLIYLILKKLKEFNKENVNIEEYAINNFTQKVINWPVFIITIIYVIIIVLPLFLTF